ncbi:MAG: hypothetical protein DHS20C17_22070 [Cyclobacteriaceae bacterium]|nr:MAG: hypothetical protein DHS20C17_22070 [Cyclobacteriaceae bacterium]
MFPFERGFSFLRFNKGGSVQKLLHLVKYQRKPDLGLQLGRWFASETLCWLDSTIDFIVPVPLHRERFKERGYNQCLEIARGISQITGHDVLEVLKRERATETQTHLSRWDRFENTLNEFVLTNPRIISNKKILLLDDIITTGATMTGSAVPLVNGGAVLYIAAIALTQDT